MNPVGPTADISGGSVPEGSEPALGSGISFGPFCLYPSEQLLVEAGKPVHLGSRALHILVALIERAGELVTKEELIARVWPNTFVEEGNIKVHIAALRRALGDGQSGLRYVLTIPGRGYSFVAPISRLDKVGTARAAPAATDKPQHNLPPALTRMVGRGATIETITTQVQNHRLVTLVGPGGIGKTTVAVAVGHALISEFADGVRYIDLVPLANPSLVASSVASVLELPVRSDDPLLALSAFLRDKRMLLVLDNCEHVIDSVAMLATHLLAAAPAVHIFATSREPLLVEREHVRRLTPLATLPQSDRLTVAEALTSPAVQLFVERATARADRFDLSAEDAPIVADICRRLDGIPLAIELAAGWVDLFGIRAIAASLDDRFRQLTLGLRRALPRHRSLNAVLDWSHELLPESERVIFRRIAVFASEFTLEAATSVVAGAGLTEVQVIDGIANLITKSLLAPNIEGSTPRYRLLDTTRAYARAKLEASGERDAIARRHAEHFKTVFERAEVEWDTVSTKDWLAAYRRQIDDLRIALDWAFSPGGDVLVGIALVVAAIPLWLQLSLVNECRVRAESALATLDPTGEPGHLQTMKLQGALGWSLMYTSGPTPETVAAWTTALELAEGSRDPDYRLRALWGLWACALNNGEFGAALALARRFNEAAVAEADRAIGDRLTGASLHFLGDQLQSRRHIERMLSRYVPPRSRSDVVRFQLDQQVAARITLPRVLWLQGLADQALRVCEANIEHASSIDHVLSLWNALVQGACPVALLAGDPHSARRFVTMLLQETERHPLQTWHSYARCFNGALLIKEGELDRGLPLLQIGIRELHQANFSQYYTAFLCTLAESLAAANRIAEAIEAIDEALARSTANDERWCAPELSRVKAELLLRAAAPNAVELAEQLFTNSLEQSRQQGALSWELRTATSIARLRLAQGRDRDGAELLAEVYARFSEGFATADLQKAASLLEDVRQAGSTSG